MTKIATFFKVVACIICLTIQMNTVSAQTWPPFGVSGQGTALDPWQITTITQLTQLASYVNAGNGLQTAGKYYKLMNNVDYHSSIHISALGWSPIGNLAVGNAIFQGNFDGNGKVVSNIWINRDQTGYIGLFGYVSSAHIHDLGVEIYQTIIGSQYVGGLIGQADHSIIENCYVTGNVTGISFVGGLIGYSVSSNI